MDEIVKRLKKETTPLQHENTSLRAVETDIILPEYVAWMNDIEVIKYTEQRFQITSEERIRSYVSKMNCSDTNLFYGIFYGEQMIGTIKLGDINTEHKTATISYLIGAKKYWGLGIASAAISELLSIAFFTLNLEKVCAGVYENNAPSIRVLEKNGFLLEGKRKAQVIFEGARIGALFYGKIKQ